MNDRVIKKLHIPAIVVIRRNFKAMLRNLDKGYHKPAQDHYNEIVVTMRIHFPEDFEKHKAILMDS